MSKVCLVQKIVRMCYTGILISLFSVFLLLSFPCQILAAEYFDTYSPENFSDFHEDELNLYAKSAVLIDGDSGRILYGKAANTPMANASTTKIMTCILAIENGKLDDVVTISDYACTMPRVKLGFSPGDTFYLRDLLYSLMLESHNDSAVAIAEYIAGSVENFSELMNEKAKKLGCENSHFITPNGLDAENEDGPHQTTAYDLAKIMAFCIDNEDFLEITRTRSVTISTTDGSKNYTLNNHNALLQMMDGAVSGKTGFTSNAGYCYVGAYRSGEHVYTFALLACGWPNHKDYKWSDSKQLISYADSHYTEKILLEGSQKITLQLSGAVLHKGDRIIYPQEIFGESAADRISGFVSDSDEIEIKYDLPKKIIAPVEKGTVIGTQKIYLNRMLYDTRQIILSESAEAFDYRWCLRWVFQSACFGYM